MIIMSAYLLIRLVYNKKLPFKKYAVFQSLNTFFLWSINLPIRDIREELNILVLPCFLECNTINVNMPLPISTIKNSTTPIMHGRLLLLESSCFMLGSLVSAALMCVKSCSVYNVYND